MTLATIQYTINYSFNKLTTQHQDIVFYWLNRVLFMVNMILALSIFFGFIAVISFVFIFVLLARRTNKITQISQNLYHTSTNSQQNTIPINFTSKKK